MCPVARPLCPLARPLADQPWLALNVRLVCGGFTHCSHQMEGAEKLFHINYFSSNGRPYFAWQTKQFIFLVGTWVGPETQSSLGRNRGIPKTWWCTPCHFSWFTKNEELNSQKQSLLEPGLPTLLDFSFPLQSFPTWSRRRRFQRKNKTATSFNFPYSECCAGWGYWSLHMYLFFL